MNMIPQARILLLLNFEWEMKSKVNESATNRIDPIYEALVAQGSTSATTF
jgi:galactokinase/mevalonate kinase-like predicted kinase